MRPGAAPQTGEVLLVPSSRKAPWQLPGRILRQGESLPDVISNIFNGLIELAVGEYTPIWPTIHVRRDPANQVILQGVKWWIAQSSVTTDALWTSIASLPSDLAPGHECVIHLAISSPTTSGKGFIEIPNIS